MKNPTFYHRPVLKREVIEALNIRQNGIYVDATMGGGGHSRAILEHLGASGKLIVFDQDADAWPNAPEDERVILVKENFRYLKRFLKLYDVDSADGIMADLGVSSFQFDTAERGFSTRYNGLMDMRMDRRRKKTAKDIVMTYSERDLQLVFEKYGEVRNAKTLATTIVQRRKTIQVTTIAEFKALIEPCVKGNVNRYLAQVFQALRIELNSELDVLKSFLRQTADCLKPSGRLCILTFHSLEDRIVKRFLRQGNFEDEIETDVFGKPLEVAPFKALPSVLPTEEEIKVNPRSRSARLRIGERNKSKEPIISLKTEY